MIVYDITCRKSFEHIQNWLQDVHDQSPKTVLTILIGNKIDLEDKRAISTDEGQEYATQNGLIFMETSAKTGEGVEEIFKISAEEIEKKMKQNYYDLKSETCGIKQGKTNNINLNDIDNNNKNKEKKGCC